MTKAEAALKLYRLIETIPNFYERERIKCALETICGK